MPLNMGSLVLHGAAKALLTGLIGLFGLSAAVAAFVGFVPSGHNGSNATYTWFSDDLTQELIIAHMWGMSLLTWRFIMFGTMTCFCVLATIFFIQLYRIVRSSENGEPFTLANARRLASMGWMLLVPVAVVAAVRIARRVPPELGMILSLGLALLAGFVLLILAGVFRRGAAMREELDGTI